MHLDLQLSHRLFTEASSDLLSVEDHRQEENQEGTVEAHYTRTTGLMEPVGALLNNKNMY